MWTIIKFDKKRFFDLKKNLKKQLGNNTIFYTPKIKVKQNSKKNLKDYEFNLLGDYVFCFNKKISENLIINSLKNTVGLKYFLNGFSICQKQIIQFIERCKKHEDDEGFLKQDFFDINGKIDFQFTSGPFNKFFFNVIEERKKKYVITLNSFKVNISKEKTLFKTI